MQVIAGRYSDSTHKNLGYDGAVGDHLDNNDEASVQSEDEENRRRNTLDDPLCDGDGCNAESKSNRGVPPTEVRRRNCDAEHQWSKSKRKRSKISLGPYASDLKFSGNCHGRRRDSDGDLEATGNSSRLASILKNKSKIRKVIQEDLDWVNKTQGTKWARDGVSGSTGLEMFNAERSMHLDAKAEAPASGDGSMAQPIAGSPMRPCDNGHTDECHSSEFPDSFMNANRANSSSPRSDFSDIQIIDQGINLPQDRRQQHLMQRNNEGYSHRRTSCSQCRPQYSNPEQPSCRAYPPIFCRRPTEQQQQPFDYRPPRYVMPPAERIGRRINGSQRRPDYISSRFHTAPSGSFGKNSFSMRRQASSNLRLRISNDHAAANFGSRSTPLDSSALHVSDLLSATTSSMFSPMSSPFLQVSLLDSPLFEDQSTGHAAGGNDWYYNLVSPCSKDYNPYQNFDSPGDPHTCNTAQSFSDSILYVTHPSSNPQQRESVAPLGADTQRFNCRASSARSNRNPHTPPPQIQQPRYCPCIDPYRDRPTTSKPEQIWPYYPFTPRPSSSATPSCHCCTSPSSAKCLLPDYAPHQFKFSSCPPSDALPLSRKCPPPEQLKLSSTCCGKRRSNFLLSAALDGWQKRAIKKNASASGGQILPLSPPQCIQDPDYSCPSLRGATAIPPVQPIISPHTVAKSSSGNGQKLGSDVKGEIPSRLDGFECSDQDAIGPGADAAALEQSCRDPSVQSLQNATREVYDPKAFRILICSHVFRSRCAAVDFVKLKSALYGFKSHIRTSKNDSIVFMCNKRRRASRTKNGKFVPSNKGTTDCSWRVITSRNRFGYWVFKSTGNFDHNHPIPANSPVCDKPLQEPSKSPLPPTDNQCLLPSAAVPGDRLPAAVPGDRLPATSLPLGADQ